MKRHEEERATIRILYHSFFKWSAAEIKMKWGRGNEYWIHIRCFGSFILDRISFCLCAEIVSCEAHLKLIVLSVVNDVTAYFISFPYHFHIGPSSIECHSKPVHFVFKIILLVPIRKSTAKIRIITFISYFLAHSWMMNDELKVMNT